MDEDIDIERLKEEVKKLGGFKKVDAKNKWIDVAKAVKHHDPKLLRKRFLEDSPESEEEDASSQKGDTGEEDKKSENDSEEYEVEEVVRQRERNGKVEYYVKWLGWEETANTWVPLEDLHCPELIEKFNNKKQTGKKKGEETKRKERIK